jgi:hypothetical protein
MSQKKTFFITTATTASLCSQSVFLTIVRVPTEKAIFAQLHNLAASIQLKKLIVVVEITCHMQHRFIFIRNNTLDPEHEGLSYGSAV